MNRLYILIAILFISSSTFAQNSAQDAKKSILSIMKIQEDNWNKGDIEAYMAGYWNSDSLLFIGGTGPQYGWKKTLDRYLKSYPNKDAMGHLTFETIRFNFLPPKNAQISGKWFLKREEGDLSGYYSLLWEMKNGEWKIIYDHSSSSN